MEALEWRKSLNKDAEASGGKIPKVSVNDCIVIATSRALIHHPGQCLLAGDHIHRYANAHVAVAMALPKA